LTDLDRQDIILLGDPRVASAGQNGGAVAAKIRKRTVKPRGYRLSATKLVQRAESLGAESARLVRASTIATAPWVRLKCQYGCDGYGSSRCCPPHTPTPDGTRKVIDCYKRAILFEAGRREPRQIAVRLEREAFLAGYYKALGLGAGPCSLCKEECAFDEPCRHPEQARPSMEACGIDVFATARANGFTIEVVRDENDEQHYFGVVLLD
jgi:predicted metal-binding protein